MTRQSSGRARALVLALSSVIAVIATAGAVKVRLGNDFNDSLPEDDPLVVSDTAVSSRFGDHYVLLVGITGSDLLTPSNLERIEQMTREVRDLPGVIPAQVASLATVGTVIEDADGAIEPVQIIDELTARAGSAAAREYLAAHPGMWNRLLTGDGSAALIVAQVSRDASQKDLYDAVYALRDRHDDEGVGIVIGGDILIMEAFNRGVQNDIVHLLPIGLLLVVLFLLLLLRRALAVVAPLVVIGFSTLVTLGLMGWLNIQLSVITSIVPVFILVAGGSYVIHLIQHMKPDGDSGQSTSALLAAALTHTRRPIVLAGFTSGTAAITLVAFRIEMIREFGVMAAVGVLACIYSTLLLLPALVDLAPGRVVKRTGNAGTQRLATAVSRLHTIAWRHPAACLVTAGTLVAIAGVGVARISVGMDMVSYLPEEHPIARDSIALQRRFGATNQIDVAVDSGRPGGARDPDFLRRVRSFQVRAEKVEGVGRTTSYADLIAEMCTRLCPEPRQPDGLPTTLEAVAQLELLAATSIGAAQLNQRIDTDNRRIRISVPLSATSDGECEEIHTQLVTLASRTFPPTNEVEYGGGTMLFIAAVRYIVNGKILNIALTGVLMLLFCSVAYRSARVALVAALPLTATSICIFGLMGFAGITLNSSTALITAVAVGIGIDFAIHHIEAIRRAATDSTCLEEAVAGALHSSGLAILADAMSNVAGFSVALLSSFTPLRNFGLLASVAMLLSATATLVLVPALVRVLGPHWLGLPAEVAPRRQALQNLGPSRPSARIA